MLMLRPRFIACLCLFWAWSVAFTFAVRAETESRSHSPQLDPDPQQLSQTLAAQGLFALAYALFPTEEYRNRLPVSRTFDLRAEVDHCHHLFQIGDFEQTASCYAHLFSLRPDLAQTLFNIAQSLRRQGKAEWALAFYRRFLSANPATPLRNEVEGYIRELTSLLTARRLLQNPPPVYKKAWFWATISSVAVTAGVVLGVTLGLRQNQPPDPPKDETLGPIDVVFAR